MKKFIGAVLAAAFAVTALVAVGTAVTGSGTSVQAGTITNRP
ncbi:hypothetical protein [Streptomyces sp. NPDC002676]